MDDHGTGTLTRGELVAHLDDLPVGTARMAKVDGRRICVVRTESGVHAIDNGCPHEGYGLTQGALDGDVLTCEWHNWKFRVTDGHCLLGEEDVPTHDVAVAPDGGVRVTVRRPDPATRRPALIDSLRRGIRKDYRGQIARDVVRLLHASSNPGELVWEAVAHGAPRAEFGWGHSVASATDCLAMVHLYEGDQRALPIVQGIVGIAEQERDRPAQRLPSPAPSGEVGPGAFRRAVEGQDVELAQSQVLGAIERGDGPAELRPWFTAVAGDHHLSYGHGAIYGQKAFELLEMIGWERAPTVLPHLVPTIVHGTREDRLPYMRPFMRALDGIDLGELAATEPDPTWRDDGTLARVMLGSDRNAVVPAAAEALRSGAGADGLLDVVIEVVSERMLRYDTAGEHDFHDDFGWLDITHGITYGNAARWHHRVSADECPVEALRLALFTVFQAQWTGRHEWHTAVGPRAEIEPMDGDVVAYGEALQRDSLLDGTTAFIVHAHAVKTSRAAAVEAARSGSTLPLDATARFMAAPKLERFVAATVTRSIDFLNGAVQRD